MNLKKVIIPVVIIAGIMLPTFAKADNSFIEGTPLTIGGITYTRRFDSVTTNQLYNIETYLRTCTEKLCVCNDYDTNTFLGIGEILEKGFNGNSIAINTTALNRDEQFFVTQMAIYKWIDKSYGFCIDNSFIKTDNLDNKLVTEVDKLLNYAKEEVNYKTFSNLIPITEESFENGSYNQQFKMVSNFDSDVFTLNSLKPINLINKTLLNTNDTVLLTTPDRVSEVKINATKDVLVKNKKMWISPKVAEIDGIVYYQNMIEKGTPTNMKSTNQILAREEARGSITVTVIDNLNNTIQYVDVELYDENDTLIETKTTNADGSVFFENKLHGNYKVKLKNIPSNYKINEDTFNISIDKNEQIISQEMEIINKTGSIELRVYDENDNTLEGAVFSLYDSMDNLIAEDLTTDKNGNLVINDLKINDYYLIQKKTNDEYIINPEKIFFSITEDGQIIKESITNEKYINLEITPEETEENVIPEEIEMPKTGTTNDSSIILMLLTAMTLILIKRNGVKNV